MDEEEKRGLADYIIENNGDLQALKREVDSLIEQLLGR
jgi:dephospho-CoA kinase